MRLLSESIIEDAFAFCPPLSAFSSLLLSALPQFTSGIAVPSMQNHFTSTHDHRVLILGGGVAGVMAAEALHHRGIDNFKVIEAHSTLGGRMKSFSFGAPGRQYVLELGADWIHGTQTNDGPSNPIFDLALKHNLSTQPNHYRGSMSRSTLTRLVHTNVVHYSDLRSYWCHRLYANFQRCRRKLRRFNSWRRCVYVLTSFAHHSSWHVISKVNGSSGDWWIPRLAAAILFSVPNLEHLMK